MMMILLEIRRRCIAVCQKVDYLIYPLLRFVLAFAAFSMLRKELNYSVSLSRTAVVMLLSLLGAFIPTSLTLLLLILYMTLQVYSVSPLMALTILFCCLILYCFFLRFTPKYGATAIALPVLRSFGLPYLVPIAMGVFGNPLTILPTGCGVFVYYLITVTKENMITLQDTLASDDPLQMYMDVLDKLLKNQTMWVLMVIYAFVIAAVYLVRRLHMDYAFEISIGVGAGVMLIGYGIAALKYEMGVGLFRVLFGTLISAAIVLVAHFFYRVLQYSAAETVQFEDDDYYYYVRAVPKINVEPAQKKVTKIISRRRDEDDEDDDEDEEIDEFDHMLNRGTQAEPRYAKVTREQPRRAQTAEQPQTVPEQDLYDEDDDYS